MRITIRGKGSPAKAARRGMSFFLLGVAALLALAASASAAIPFCTFGTSPGECNRPGGVAVDRSTGRVYVVDKGNSRVNAFDENGNFLLTFGSLGTAPGQLTNPTNIAVDNDPVSPAFHDVYVSDSPPGTPRVQRFSPSGTFVSAFPGGRPAVGPGGAVYIGSATQIKIFSPAGAPLGSSNLPGTASASDLAIDSNGDAYVVRNGGVEKYELTEPTATQLYARDLGTNTRAVAVDASDNVFAQHIHPGDNIRAIVKYSPSGQTLKRFGYGLIEFNLEGLAIGATGDSFGSEENVASTTVGNRVVRISQPPPGPVACCLVAQTRNTSATLQGRLNPEGKSTTYHFEYISEAQFEANGNSFGAGTVKTAESASVGADFVLHSAETQIGCTEPTSPPQASCLEPSTAYRFRLVATNADGQASVEGTFETKPPFELKETYATEVGTDAAQLHAIINPLGIPATAYFEYVDDASFQADLAEGEGHDGFGEASKVPNVDAGQAPISTGSGETATDIVASVASLTPGATYHYRVVVEDPFAALTGPGQTFTTFPLPRPPSNSCPNGEFRVGSSANLPGCRAYEMVSPVEKNGNDIKVLVSLGNFPARLDQSAEDGNGFAYSSSTAFGDAVAAAYSSEYLARRGASGWSTHAINPPRQSTSITDDPGRFDLPFRTFSSDLSSGWLFHDTDPPLDPCAPEGIVNLYRRDNASGAYEALITSEPLNSKVAEEETLPELQGVSADGSHAVFVDAHKLTEDAADVTNYQIYEHIAGPNCGQLRLVSVKPNGSPLSSGSQSAGGGSGYPGESRSRLISRAVSADGTRVFFTNMFSVIGGAGPLYVRLNADQEQSAVSGGECTEADKACTLQISSAAAEYWTASRDGSKAIYSVGENLFEFDVDKALAGEEANTLIAEGFAGVADASEDASRVYFVSEEELGGEGEAGERNLYLYDSSESGAERYRFVATLEGFAGGFPQWGVAVATGRPIENGVRVTPDGRHLAFVSTRSLTGYDNRDAVGGQPVLEVYLYDVEADKLACISCNPSEGRPTSRLFVGNGSVNVAAMMAPAENQAFAPRALSADGSRLFFESFDALLPRDTNGKADVYEWQQAGGQEECGKEGADLFVASAGGCLSLISSGQSPIDSEFADASPDGSNVFIRTASSLLPQDPGLVDIYDARVNGGFPQPPSPPVACEGEACQGPPAPPNDPTPASSTFQGGGNVKESKPRCARKKIRRKGRCVPRKSHKRANRTHQKRANHKRRAAR
jgi:hypothetical protein